MAARIAHCHLAARRAILSMALALAVIVVGADRVLAQNTVVLAKASACQLANTLTVTVTDGASDAAPVTVSAQVVVEVIRAENVVVDRETMLSFSAVVAGVKFVSAGVPIADLVPDFGDGVLEARCGDIIRANYDDGTTPSPRASDTTWLASCICCPQGSTCSTATGARTHRRAWDQGGAVPIGSPWLAQTFTVDLAGSIAGFTLKLQVHPPFALHDFEWRLLPVDASGIPDSTNVIDSGQFSAGDDSGPSPMHVDLHRTLCVAVGDHYAIALRRITTTGLFDWMTGEWAQGYAGCPPNSAVADPYAGGLAFVEVGGGVFGVVSPAADFNVVVDVCAGDTDGDGVPDAIEGLTGAPGIDVAGGAVTCAETLSDGSITVCLTDDAAQQLFTFTLPSGTVASGPPVLLKAVADAVSPSVDVTNAIVPPGKSKEVSLPRLTTPSIFIKDTPSATTTELGTGSNSGTTGVLAKPTQQGCNSVNTNGDLTPWTVWDDANYGRLVVRGLANTALGLFDDPDHDLVASSIDNCPSTPNADQIDTDHDGRGDACDAFQCCIWTPQFPLNLRIVVYPYLELGPNP